MHARVRVRLVAVVLVAVAALAVGGCASLTFVKPRLAPPAPSKDGFVTFRYYAPYARRVQVGGDWEDNRWLAGNAEISSTDVGLMQGPDRNGMWTATFKLPPGRHQYKYRIDYNTWKEDPNNPERVDDGFGGFNSLVVVK